MPRRNKKGGETISLFPFLSILACVIGVLTLMITALALGQMDNQEVAEIEVIDNADKQIADEKKKAEKSRQEIEKLKQQINSSQSQSNELLKQLAQRREELEQLLKELGDARQGKAELAPIQRVDKAQLDKRLEDLQKDIKEVQDQMKPLEAMIADRKKPPDEAVVQVRPSGSGVDLDPTFVECASDSIVIYDEAEQRRVRRADVPNDEKFLTMLEEIARKPKASLIFLVRDDGLGTYYTARGVAQGKYARNGKLPVIGHGTIDLSQFRE